MKHKYIYIIYLFILLSALSWRVTKAYPSLTEIKNIDISEADSLTLVTINLSKPTKVVPFLKKIDNCIILEFDKAYMSENLKSKAFSGRDIKLAYLSALNKTSSKTKDSKPQNIKKVRAKFFIKPDCLPTVKYSDNKVTLKLSVKDNLSKITDEPYHSLMKPTDNNNSPIVISLEKAPFKSVVAEIASQAGMNIEFKGKVPETFSIDLQSKDPFNALCSIAVETGMNFYKDGKIWIMEGKI